MIVLQYLKQDDPKVSPWQKTCSAQQCTDDGVQLTVRPGSGKAVLRRRRLEVIYFPPYFREKNKMYRPKVRSWGYLSVQCGHENFRSNENYPAVLCGKLQGTFVFRDLAGGGGRVKTRMAANKLKLNDDKTESLLIASNRIHFPNPPPISIYIWNIDIPFSS